MLPTWKLCYRNDFSISLFFSSPLFFFPPSFVLLYFFSVYVYAVFYPSRLGGCSANLDVDNSIDFFILHFDGRTILPIFSSF